MHVCMHVCVCVRARVCVCVCASEKMCIREALDTRSVGSKALDPVQRSTSRALLAYDQ